MRLIQLMLLLMTTFCASESVYFIPIDTVGAVYDSWVVTFTVDMLPYQQHLISIRKLVRQYEQAFNYLAHESRALPSASYSDVLRKPRNLRMIILICMTSSKRLRI